ncbi:MAG: AAA family ATPase, partial [Moraxellaceae bacterium]|nr:AAA family ATPase [Moraxellaceae bacterium]
FDFELSYEAHGKITEVKSSRAQGVAISVDGQAWTRTRFKERIQESSLRPPFPAAVFGYYSGTCERLRKQFRRYGRTYSAKLRGQSDDMEKSFIFSDVDQAEYVLLALLANRNGGLLKEISILSLDKLKITVRPGEDYSLEQDEPKFWGAKGAVLEFLADLDGAAIDAKSVTAMHEGESSVRELSRTYILNQIGLEKVGSTSNSRRGANISSMLEVLERRSMLVGVDYTLRHIDGFSIFPFSDLSEGEKQLISVIGGLSLIGREECLVLLDEPDTHLNPAWTWRYNSLLKGALDDNSHASSVALIATHNPVLISGLTREQVLIAHSKSGRLSYERPYRDPRGQGVANVLTSEFFGLPSSLDEHTQGLIDERLRLAYKDDLSADDIERLAAINRELDVLGLSISFRDPAYKDYLESKYRSQEAG